MIIASSCHIFYFLFIFIYLFLQLWYHYLKERLVAVRALPIDNVSHDVLNNTFERALAHMNKMPRIWLMYIEYLVKQYNITKLRRTCDKALMALPIMQHERIWTVYLVRSIEFATNRGVAINYGVASLFILYLGLMSM